MKKMLFVLIAMGFISQTYAQDPIQLDELLITVNYKYYNAVQSQDAAVVVDDLETKVAFHNMKSSEFYNDEYEDYSVSFYIPDGKIVVAYDKDGTILRTIEKFKNVRLPYDVSKAVAKRFPNWEIVKDVYYVKYHKGDDVAKKVYKIVIKNGDETLRVKTDEYGNFL